MLLLERIIFRFIPSKNGSKSWKGRVKNHFISILKQKSWEQLKVGAAHLSGAKIWFLKVFSDAFWPGAKNSVNNRMGYHKKFVWQKNFFRGLLWCVWKFRLLKKFVHKGGMIIFERNFVCLWNLLGASENFWRLPFVGRKIFSKPYRRDHRKRCGILSLSQRNFVGGHFRCFRSIEKFMHLRNFGRNFRSRSAEKKSCWDNFVFLKVTGSKNFLNKK